MFNGVYEMGYCDGEWLEYEALFGIVANPVWWETGVMVGKADGSDGL